MEYRTEADLGFVEVTIAFTFKPGNDRLDPPEPDELSITSITHVPTGNDIAFLFDQPARVFFPRLKEAVMFGFDE